jgi:Flp pilus assembly protein TadB
VSKQRARTREQRQAEAARRTAEERARREKVAADRARRERRSLTWRRLRLWQHGTGFRRNKDSWAALGTLAMVVLLLAYLLTSSWHVVLLVVLVLVVAFPALVMLTFDRRNK